MVVKKTKKAAVKKAAPKRKPAAKKAVAKRKPAVKKAAAKRAPAKKAAAKRKPAKRRAAPKGIVATITDAIAHMGEPSKPAKRRMTVRRASRAKKSE